MFRRLWPPLTTLASCILLFSLPSPPARAQVVVSPVVTLADTAIVDQDDMCIWVHPTDRSLSTVIASDKAAGKIFVYDLEGVTLQTVVLEGGQPGNIDIRYNFELQGKATDIVAVNGRNRDLIYVFRVNPKDRHLERIDDGAIETSNHNYGLCCYVSPVTGKYYAFCVTESGHVEQFELYDDSGQVGGTLVRSWDVGSQTEGMVADDEMGAVFYGEEDVAIWKLGAEPNDPTDDPMAVAMVGDASGLKDDIEGLTIYYAADGDGYLIASSQGNDTFRVFARKAPHAYLGYFELEHTSETDGIDVTNVNLGPSFPQGLFAAHNNRKTPKPVELCRYEDLQLTVDTDSWDPREGSGVATLLALVGAESSPDRVQVTWYGGAASGLAATVYRRTEATPWSVRSHERIDGTGRLAFVDRDVRPGTRYGYRVGIDQQGQEIALGETWVEVPSDFHLGLEGVRPNPVDAHSVVSFALRDASPAVLELYDTQGRRRWSKHVESLGPGNHVMHLGRIPDLSPGVYHLRLTQSGVSMSVRATFLR